MSLPLLKQEYVPANVGPPKYDQVYTAILTHQAKDDRTARCYLSSATDNNTSRFESGDILDPMEDVPFGIAIRSTKRHQALSFTKSELSSFAAPESIPEGPGISAVISLADSHCGVQFASGILKMKRVWTKLNPDGEFVEIFEGFVSFNVSYSGLYKGKGHGNGEKFKSAFWAVRARRDKAGKEIGLRPMTPVSISSITDDYVEVVDPVNNPANEVVQLNQVGDDPISEVFLPLIFSGYASPKLLRPQDSWEILTPT